jgi:hypothetical protein
MTAGRVLAALTGAAAATPLLRRVRLMQPVAPGHWPLTSQFALCGGTCPGEQPHVLHRDGAMTCHQCKTTTRSPR